MSNRLIFVLLLTATLYATAASLIGLSSPHAARADAVSALEGAPAAGIPVLPTVVVRADTPPTLLPTVTVTADPAEIAAAMAAPADPLAGTVLAAHHIVAGSLLSSPSFGMPYYSFGKSMYRVNKE